MERVDLTISYWLPVEGDPPVGSQVLSQKLSGSAAARLKSIRHDAGLDELILSFPASRPKGINIEDHHVTRNDVAAPFTARDAPARDPIRVAEEDSANPRAGVLGLGSARPWRPC